MQTYQTILKILSNQNRFMIISLLADSKKDLCVNEIASKVGISQSLASHQLSYLEARGLVEGARMGQTICYELSAQSITQKTVKVIKFLR